MRSSSVARRLAERSFQATLESASIAKLRNAWEAGIASSF